MGERKGTHGWAAQQRERGDRCRDEAMSGALMAAKSGARMTRTSASRIDVRRRETALALVGGPQLLRAVIGELIGAQPGMRLAGSVASIDELAESFEHFLPRCDVVLLDVDSYRGGCARAIDRLLAFDLDFKLVLLCTEVSEEIVICASTRRIDGVVLKESSVCELCEAVAHILTGHAVMPARWRAATATRRSPSASTCGRTPSSSTSRRSSADLVCATASRRSQAWPSPMTIESRFQSGRAEEICPTERAKPHPLTRREAWCNSRKPGGCDPPGAVFLGIGGANMLRPRPLRSWGTSATDSATSSAAR